MKERQNRLNKIKELIQIHHIDSQEMLLELLVKEGFHEHRQPYPVT